MIALALATGVAACDEEDNSAADDGGTTETTETTESSDAATDTSTDTATDSAADSGTDASTDTASDSEAEAPADDATATADGGDECGAAAFAELVGQPRSALEGQTLPEGTRVAGPTDAVTSDFNPTRLNITTDADDVIVKVECG
ncbi:hypothetical protein GSH16_05595 [Rhodobacteraceae bacterium KN286]|uniref:Peptidase inhibitor I78 family protein n=2 Tax=Oceanomicrobium pacificus TaxID=2692916 RepID=A0A6B0TK78_9RHOB|nr:hypothetical protein [Oceanomicrobium pacificus]